MFIISKIYEALMLCKIMWWDGGSFSIGFRTSPYPVTFMQPIVVASEKAAAT